MTGRDSGRGEGPARQAHLPLFAQVQDLLEAEGRRFLRTVAEVVEVAGAKAVADTLGIDPSYLSHALAGRRPFRLGWLLIIADRHDPDSRIVRHLCRATGHAAPKRAAPVTPDRYAAAARRVLKRHGLRDIEAEIAEEAESDLGEELAP